MRHIAYACSPRLVDFEKSCTEGIFLLNILLCVIEPDYCAPVSGAASRNTHHFSSLYVYRQAIQYTATV